MSARGAIKLPASLSWRRVGMLALPALLAVLLRAPFFAWLIEVDEAVYSYTAHWWFRGVPLYSDQLWLDRFQGIFLVYKLGAVLLGEATWAIRLWGALWAAAVSIALYGVGKRLIGEREGFLGALLFAVFSAAPHVEGFTVNGEILMALPATLSAYFAYRRRPFWAGLLAVCAMLIKPSGATAGLLAALWLVYTRAHWRAWLCLALGGLIPALLSVAHGALTVGLAQYAYAVALFEMGAGWGPHISVAEAALAGWAASVPVWLPLAGLGGPALRSLPKAPRLFVLLWLGTSLVGMALGGRWYPHYFTQLLPPLALCAGAGLAQFLRSRRRFVRIVGVAVPVACFVLCEGRFYLLPPQQGMSTLYNRPDYRIADQVAAYIRAHTSPDEAIYVAFEGPSIYQLAQRRSVFPYLYWIHLMYYPGGYDRLVQVIRNREPTYVLALDPPFRQWDPENRFGQALEEGYRIEKVFEWAPLYRRK